MTDTAILKHIRQTNAARQQSRRQKLNQIAKELGYRSWAQLETAAIWKEVKITRTEQEQGETK